MKIIIDTEAKILTCEQAQYPLYSKTAFEIISAQWLKVGWDQKYPYTFSWMGRPIIQIPEDIVRTQEVIYRVKPDVLIETGVAHGGSLIFYASLFKAMGKGRVIGVDVEIRPHNRQAIEAHEMFPLITLIEGNSVADSVLKHVRSLVNNGETVMVILDSNHSRDHVMAELNAYCDLVSKGSYIVATDGSMKDLYDVPRGHSSWTENNPVNAVHDFCETHPEFLLEKPSWTFSESQLTENITHWPDAWLRRI